MCCWGLISSPSTRRGLGYAFITHFASQSDTTIIGIARNKKATEKRLKKDGISSVTILQGDVTDHKALQSAAEATARITDGSLDLLMHNAVLVTQYSTFKTLPEFAPQELEDVLLSMFQANVIGSANTINAFLPLIRKGHMKKVITISSGLADDSLTNSISLGVASPYAISKAGANTLVAKFNAAMGKSERILFLAISPGVIDTSEGKQPTEEELKGMQEMDAKCLEYAPHFKGPMPPSESVGMVMDVVEKATVKTFGGQYVSLLGNKQWL